LCLILDAVASRWVTESLRDPVILSSVSLLLTAAVVACLAPARRAA
jgi:hypothetical protein